MIMRDGADKENEDGITDMANITQKQFSGKHKEITDEQRQLINDLTADPFILEDDRADIEQFISRFPLLWKSYIPVSIIGEGITKWRVYVYVTFCVGTFSTVYKAIDVQHFDTDNGHWKAWSRQDPEDAPRLLAFVQRLMEGWSAYFAQNNNTTNTNNFGERKEHLSSFSNLNMSIKNYVHDYVRRLLTLQYDGQSKPSTPPIAPHFVALKRINPTSSPERLIDEISFLKELGGKHNVVPVISGMRYQDQVIVVFPYFYCPDFREYLCELRPVDISCYMRLLFEALAHIHSHSIIHRDIKPSNFLFSAEDKRAVLVDFGLAQREGQDEHQNNGNNKTTSKLKQEDVERQVSLLKEKLSKLPPGVVVNDNRPSLKASRAGTRGFRAPEVLFKCTQQTCAIDMWSAGVIMLTLMTRRYPFFQSSDDQDAIVEIACLFGTTEMAKAAQTYQRQWLCDVPTVPETRIGWRELVKGMNPEGYRVLPEDAYDLLDRCLRLDVRERVTAREALNHPFIKLSL